MVVYGILTLIIYPIRIMGYLFMFVTYDRPNGSTDRYEIFGNYSVPSGEGHYDIKFLKDRNNVRRVTVSNIINLLSAHDPIGKHIDCLHYSV